MQKKQFRNVAETLMKHQRNLTETLPKHFRKITISGMRGHLEISERCKISFERLLKYF